MTWCTDVSVIPEHGMSISGSAWDSRLRPAPIWIDQTDQTLPRYCSKKALAAKCLTFIHLFMEKVYISTKIQATCFEEFLSTFTQDHHMISSSSLNYVFMSNLVTWWIQIDFMLHIIPCIRPEGKLKSVRAAKIRLGTADGRLNWHLIYLHNWRWITFKSQEDKLELQQCMLKCSLWNRARFLTSFERLNDKKRLLK